MKKLMTMIAAVATAFGLFAVDADYNGTSFESDETTVSEGKFTPDGTVWTSELESFDVIDYGAETPYVYTEKRRDGEFPAEDTNLSYLKLADATKELTRTASEGDIFIDQLVKFTSFDEVPVLDAETKIAIWKAGLEAEDGTITNSSLCVAVGDGAGNVKHVRLTNEVADDTWYRVTVRKDGLVTAEAGEGQIGYAIFINEQPAVIVADDRDYHFDSTILTPTAQYLYNNGKLFTSIPSELTSFGLASVSYKGQGAIDDVIVSATGPEFAAASMVATITAVENATLTGVTVGGETNSFEVGEGVYTFQITPGMTATLTFAPVEGYKLATTTKNVTVTSTDPIDVSADIVPVEVFATKVNDDVTTEYGEAELYGMINGLVDGDIVTFNKYVTITEESDTIYEGPAGTTITVTEDEGVTSWAVAVAGEAASFRDYVGATETIEKAYTFEDEDGILDLCGDIASTFTVNLGQVEVNDDIEVTGTLTAPEITINYSITLGVDAAVTVADTTALTVDDFESFDESYEVIVDETVSGFKTFKVQPAAPTTFAVTAAAAAAHTKLTVQTNDVDLVGVENVYTANIGDTIVVTYTADEGYEFADGAKTSGEFTTDDLETFETAPVPVIKNFTVTYIVNGVEDSTEQVNWGETPAKVPSPEVKTGYTGAWDVSNPAEVVIKEPTTFTYTYTAETYTITYMYGEQTLTLAPSNYTYGVGATLPDKATATPVIGAELEGWYDNKDLTGTAVTAIGTEETGVKTFWAKIVSVTPAGEVEKKVDGEVTDAGKTVVNAIVAATGSDQTKVDAYVAKVYGGDKMPAADVNAADPALVPASMYYGLPLMSAEPEVTVVAAAAETGAAAFTFTVNVNGKPADLVKAEAQKMVKYTTKLGDDKTPFHESIPDEVTITAKNDGTMKAEFAAGEATAGFMKVDVSMPAE